MATYERILIPLDGSELAEGVLPHAIAMSTHGRSGLRRLVFGSVADQVLRNSHLPVLLIRAGG